MKVVNDYVTQSHATFTGSLTTLVTNIRVALYVQCLRAVFDRREDYSFRTRKQPGHFFIFVLSK